MRSKWCPGYKKRNLDFIDNNNEGLFDVDELRRSLDSNRKRFAEVFNDAEFRDLIDSLRFTRPPFISLPGLKRPYIYRGINE
jgi:Ca2+-binding EF-hand superfamily protein